jgi:hypothetical protein
MGQGPCQKVTSSGITSSSVTSTPSTSFFRVVRSVSARGTRPPGFALISASMKPSQAPMIGSRSSEAALAASTRIRIVPGPIRSARIAAPTVPNPRAAYERLILERLFQKLEHTDNAIVEKLEQDLGGKKTGGGLIDWRIFCDSLIPWRYATSMYKAREYLGALNEAQIGLQLWDKLRQNSVDTSDIPFLIPERVLFSRRIVEYEICHEMTQLRYNTASVAGMAEGCTLVAAKAPEWITRLDRVYHESKDLAERAKALCYQILIRLCVASALAFQGRPWSPTDLEPYLGEFRDMGGSEIDTSTKIKTWWLVCKAIASPEERGQQLGIFRERVKSVRHHPPEKLRFEELCGSLLEMWPEGASTPSGVFTSRALDMLQEEVKAIQSVTNLAVDVKRMMDVLGEAKKEHDRTGTIGEEKRDGWRRKLRDAFISGSEKVIVDSVTVGIRTLLGI